MDLTKNQRETLTELINIGYGRAAGALSELTGHRITLEVPKVALHAIEEVTGILSEVVKGEVASVNQIFSGPLSGNALLLLDERAALLLNELLTDEKVPSRSLDSSAREVITEVGNILLNACLGIFGNLLQVQVTFSVPRMSVDTVESILHSITVRDQGLRYAIMIHTRFYVRAKNVSGYLVIILGVTSFERLMIEMKRWEERQVAQL
jgi:chemotaxis protein CheC